MHAVKMMLVWIVYATAMLYGISSAETDDMDGCENWDVRLVGALGGQSGLLEVRCGNDTWSTVRWCDYWNISDGIASIVCRQLGYSQINATVVLEPYSEKCEGSSPQHFVYCEGTESKLAECNFSRDCSGSIFERVQVNCQSTTSSNCNAVGGTLGTLVILLVLLLSVTVAGLAYFLMKEFKINRKLRARSPRAQPKKPAQKGDTEVPDEQILHNPVYAAGAVGAHTKSTDAVTSCQYSVLGPENVDMGIARPKPSGKFRYTN